MHGAIGACGVSSVYVVNSMCNAPACVAQAVRYIGLGTRKGHMILGCCALCLFTASMTVSIDGPPESIIFLFFFFKRKPAYELEV